MVLIDSPCKHHALIQWLSKQRSASHSKIILQTNVSLSLKSMETVCERNWEFTWMLNHTLIYVSKLIHCLFKLWSDKHRFALKLSGIKVHLEKQIMHLGLFGSADKMSQLHPLTLSVYKKKSNCNIRSLDKCSIFLKSINSDKITSLQCLCL